MAALTDVYRRQTLALRAATLRDLHRLWPALDWNRLDGTYPAWFAAVSTLIARDRLTAAGLASGYLRAFRMSQEVPGAPTIVLPKAVPAEQLAISLRVTTLIAAKRAASKGLGEKAAMAQAFVQSSGAATRMVLNAGRETIQASAVADPHAAGWQREGSGECAFCAMLIGRGAVYSEASADFASHDHCTCIAVPAFDGAPRPVRPYTPTNRNITDADRARVRSFLRDHPNE